MRTIKFRAWHKHNEKIGDMLTDNDTLIYFPYNAGYVDAMKEIIWLRKDIKEAIKNNKIKKFFDGFYPWFCGSLNEGIKYSDHFVYMQYTGLKDKHEKEIYEGDIVVNDGYIWFDKGKPNYRGTVEWIFSSWQVVAHCVNSGKRVISEGSNEDLNYDGSYDGECTDWEVIGNIYENPELLKKG